MSASAWRNEQLKWYGGDVLLQDHELQQFVSTRNISKIKYAGDYGYIADLLGKQYDTNYEMCVYIVNSPFTFDTVVNNCNNYLESSTTGGFLYVAINKFLAIPEPNVAILEENYDRCILNFMQDNVSYPLVQYHSGEIDSGIRFNWAHPITRFYFQNENT